MEAGWQGVIDFRAVGLFPTQLPVVAVGAFFGHFRLVEVYIRMENLLEQGLQPFAEFRFVAAEIFNCFLGFAGFTQLNHGRIVVLGCLVDVEQSRSYPAVRLLATQDGGIQEGLEDVVRPLLVGDEQ